MYIYVYIYMYIYVYICIYMYIYTCSTVFNRMCCHLTPCTLSLLQMMEPYLLLFGRRLTVNVTVDTLCETQPSSRCRRERIELVLKINGTSIIVRLPPTTPTPTPHPHTGTSLLPLSIIAAPTRLPPQPHPKRSTRHLLRCQPWMTPTPSQILNPKP